MADPKYANLPGIDVEGSDMYECGDLPEEDQHVKQEDPASQNVELIGIDTAAAFDKFSGKYLSGVGRTQTKQAPASLYSAVAAGEEETVLQKYNRLKMEVGDLMEDVKNIKQSAKDSTSPSTLLQHIEVLNQQLKNDDIQQVTSDLKADADVNKVLSALKDLTSSTGKPSAAAKTDGSYQLYLKPGHVERQGLKFAELEQRIASLEKILGPNSQEMSSLLSHSRHGNLQDSLHIMEVKLSLLDPEQLPQVDSRLQAILNKVNEINKAHKAGGDQPSEVNQKIKELYELTRKWEGVRVGLPQLIDRLKVLNTLHVQASEFTSTMTHLEKTQTQITERMDSANSTQQKILEMIKQNSTTIESNIAQLQKRMAGLKK